MCGPDLLLNSLCYASAHGHVSLRWRRLIYSKQERSKNFVKRHGRTYKRGWSQSVTCVLRSSYKRIVLVTVLYERRQPVRHFRDVALRCSLLHGGSLQGGWPTRNFSWVGHNAFGPVNKLPLSYSYVKLVCKSKYVAITAFFVDSVKVTSRPVVATPVGLCMFSSQVGQYFKLNEELVNVYKKSSVDRYTKLSFVLYWI